MSEEEEEQEQKKREKRRRKLQKDAHTRKLGVLFVFVFWTLYCLLFSGIVLVLLGFCLGLFLVFCGPGPPLGSPGTPGEPGGAPETLGNPGGTQGPPGDPRGPWGTQKNLISFTRSKQRRDFLVCLRKVFTPRLIPPNQLAPKIKFPRGQKIWKEVHRAAGRCKRGGRYVGIWTLPRLPAQRGGGLTPPFSFSPCKS